MSGQSESMQEATHNIAILLCTYNSSDFLEEQLDSIGTQSHHHWSVWVSDDGSQDNTADILEKYRNQWGEQKLSVQAGPQQGYALNFFSLINNRNIREDYYAYSDHDDVWMEDKLARAIEWLKTIPEDTPALYCSRTCVVDHHLKKIGFSPLFRRTPSFGNAIVQNIGGGNTMVLNQTARSLLQKLDISDGIVSHDWLTYQVVTACGGKVFYDSKPTLYYRQHKRNLVGENNSFLARLYRIKMLYRGQFREWNTSNIKVINTISPHLCPANLKVIENLIHIRNSNILYRVLGLRKLTVYRQTWFSNLVLYAAIVFKRF